MSAPKTNSAVINWPNTDAEFFNDWSAYDPSLVRKIVLGPSPGSNETLTGLDVAKLLEALPKFTQVTHLYLWNLAGLKYLPVLPSGLQCLDVRGCAELEHIVALPTAELETLVFWECPALAFLPPLETVPNLEELDLRSLPLVEENWIEQALTQATQKLWKLNLSGCSKLTRLPRLKVGLKDLRANDCPKLTGLPTHWPAGLRRLELANTPITAEAFPAWVDSLDYLNLSGMKKLTSLPAGLAEMPKYFPRTLFLYGSGVRQPPAVLHGKGATDNAAPATLRYFQQGKALGYGSIRRCKLLFLGNGQAGKTSLALSLEGDPTPAATAQRDGSTHGIRLHSRSITPKGTKTTDPVRLDHWDFGGQEIYHNAHCKFVQTGSLFLLVWYPEQDGKTEATCPVTGYKDILHPLRYWLDLIFSRTSGLGRVLIVASHCERLTDPLLRRCNQQRVGYVQESIGVKAHDANTRTGQLPDIDQWIRENAGKLVEAEGEQVPAHWQIAEGLVNRWLNDSTPGRSRDLSFDQFRDEFSTEVLRRIAEDPYGDFAQLADAIRQPDGFRVDDEITRQTLHVLTNLGALYWSEDLFDRRVIIGQDWALQGIYAALDRRPESSVFKVLQEAHGRFSRSLLADLVWNSNPDYAGTAVQELLISFMEDCQICFRLSGERWDGHRFREPEYVSIKHLPTSEELRIAGTFADQFDLGHLTLHSIPAIENKFMNASHWHAILADLGKAYGDGAQYAVDGFCLPKNDKGQSALIYVELDTSLEGKSRVFVETHGPDHATLKQEIVNTLIARLPDATSGKLSFNAPGALRLAGDLSKRVTLFISYARNTDPTSIADQYPYEDAINAIEARLAGQSNIVILRDRNEIKDVSPAAGSVAAASVVGFMEQAAKADFILMVHSEKYWKSQYCMFEAWKSYEALHGQSTSPAAKFLLLDQGTDVSNLGGQRFDMSAIQAYWGHFLGSGQISAGLAGGGIAKEQLASGVLNFLTNFYLKLQPNNAQRVVWDPGKVDAIVEWIVKRCGFQVIKGES
jgi:hypothetical protein